MKEKFLRIIFLLAGVIFGVVASLFLPIELRERLSRNLAGVIEGMVNQMPDG